MNKGKLRPWVAREETALCLGVGVARLVHNKSITWALKNEKKILKWSKIKICEPLKDKDANEKDIHMENTFTGETSKLARGNGNKV